MKIFKTASLVALLALCIWPTQAQFLKDLPEDTDPTTVMALMQPMNGV